MTVEGSLEDLHEVECFDRLPTAIGQAAEVHQAAHVSGDYKVGIARCHVLKFQTAHGRRNMREAHRKCAAEAAALLGLTEWNDLETIDGLEELQGRVATAGAACVAGAVKGDAGWKTARPFFDAKTIDEKISELPSAVGQFLHSWKVFFLLELKRRAVEEHRGTRTGRHDDWFVAFEHARGVSHDLARGRPVAAIEGWLAAAGLVLREFDFAASVLKHLDGRFCHTVEKSIAEASGHELNGATGGAGGALCHESADWI